ncbi:hypothetical protein ZWY2020_025898 [Hordeum vulgare]|nr:hypothetical protein ZWY2020_025898 [Hordeum vulgare]
MQNLPRRAPRQLDHCKVSTVHSMAVLASSDPPSSGAFSTQTTRRRPGPRCWTSLRQNGGPFMAESTRTMPRITSRTRRTRDETLAFCLFQPNPGRVDAASGLTYMNMFDARSSTPSGGAAGRQGVRRRGHRNRRDRVARTKGGRRRIRPAPRRTTPGAYSSNLVAHLRSQVGTPRTARQAGGHLHLRALYRRGPQKPGPCPERSFGLYQTDLTANYDIRRWPKAAPLPAHPGQIQRHRGSGAGARRTLVLPLLRSMEWTALTLFDDCFAGVRRQGRRG